MISVKLGKIVVALQGDILFCNLLSFNVKQRFDSMFMMYSKKTTEMSEKGHRFQRSGYYRIFWEF